MSRRTNDLGRCRHVIESIDEIGRWLRMDTYRMSVFRTTYGAFISLCESNAIDPQGAFAALAIIAHRASRGIDPHDGRPAVEINRERKEVNS